MYRHLLKNSAWEYLPTTARIHAIMLLRVRNTMPVQAERYLCGPKRWVWQQPSIRPSCNSLGPLQQKNTALSVSPQRFLHRLTWEQNHAGIDSSELLEKTLPFLQ